MATSPVPPGPTTPATESNNQQNGTTSQSSTSTAQSADKKAQQPDKKAEDDKKISGAELKKRAKEEKAARRAAEKAAKDASSAASSIPQQQQKAGSNPGAPQRAQGQQQNTSTQQVPQSSAAHRRPSQGAAAMQQNAIPFRGKTTAPAVKEPKKPIKEVGLFGHLYSQPKKHTLEGVSKEVHPAVLALGLQMSNYVVCGSNARCVGMLLAFKKAIQDYKTPQGTSLARHLTSHHLSPQIEYLKSHRPISVSMGNAIRWLKDQIIHIDPSTPESLAKADICSSIDLFIRERITLADTAIAASACAKIRPGSTVVVFGKSSIVEKTLLRAHDLGTDFRVVVLDSRPLFEGRNLASSLATRGVRVTYMLHTGAAHALKDADLVLLGAHAMMSNGRLYSRVGTAAVAMLAHARDVPVIVCCESIKFTDRVALDSIVLNEIAPPDELVIATSPSNISSEPIKSEPVKKGNSAAKKQDEEKSEGSEEAAGLKGWRDVSGLQLLNILYDVTPAEYINMVITEYGSLPPSSVPVVHRISTERDVRT